METKLKDKKETNVNDKLMVAESIAGKFIYPDESRLVYASLLIKGYNRNDIKFALPQKMPKKYVETNETPNKSIRNLKIGALFGGAVSIAIVLLYLVLTEVAFTENSILISMLGIGVGILWGALLGGIIGPFLPASTSIKIKSLDRDSTATIRFKPRNRIDALYFKNKWHFQTE